MNCGSIYFDPCVSSIPHILFAPDTAAHVVLRLLAMDRKSMPEVISTPGELTVTSLGAGVIASKINYPNVLSGIPKIFTPIPIPLI